MAAVNVLGESALSRLLGLKEWVTLGEAAAHLSAVLNEPVSVADIYRFALSGTLTLSAHFVNHGRANLGREVRIRDAGFKLMPGLREEETVTAISVSKEALPEFDAWIQEDPSRKEWFMAEEPRNKFILLNGVQISATTCVQLDKHVSTIDGVWDLVMHGNDRIDVEYALQQEIGGPAVELTSLDDLLLKRPDGTYARLLEHFNENEYATDEMKSRKWDDPKGYFPAGKLPEDAPFVVRPSVLTDFVVRVSGRSVTPVEESTGKPPRLRSDREATLLRVIAGIWALSELPQKPTPAADKLSALFDSWGWEKPDAGTIAEKVLAETLKLDRIRK